MSVHLQPGGSAGLGKSRERKVKDEGAEERASTSCCFEGGSGANTRQQEQV